MFSLFSLLTTTAAAAAILVACSCSSVVCASSSMSFLQHTNKKIYITENHLNIFHSASTFHLDYYYIAEPFTNSPQTTNPTILFSMFIRVFSHSRCIDRHTNNVNIFLYASSRWNPIIHFVCAHNTHTHTDTAHKEQRVFFMLVLLELHRIAFTVCTTYYMCRVHCTKRLPSIHRVYNGLLVDAGAKSARQSLTRIKLYYEYSAFLLHRICFDILVIHKWTVNFSK